MNTMSANRAAWEEADFTEVAAFMRRSGETVVRSLDVTASMRVLDLGCGDGTTALPLARTGAEVLGVDIARNLVEAGRRRAADAGLERLRIVEGDACRLEGVPDNAFDLTLSMFGAMFAPCPFDVAREMVRVTRPGGRIVMGNWIPDHPSLISQLRRITASLLPPTPGGGVSTLRWGLPGDVLERFGSAGVRPTRIFLAEDHYAFSSAHRSPAEFVDAFVRFYQPTFCAAGAMGKLDEFRGRLLELALSQNTRTDGGTFIPATYLRVTVCL